MKTVCTSCGAPIIWAVTVSGAAMPVDVQPSARGNLLLEESEDPRQPPFATVVRGRQPAGPKPLRLSHFATCPDAKKWRGKP
jgi:hypothetical protein